MLNTVFFFYKKINKKISPFLTELEIILEVDQTWNAIINWCSNWQHFNMPAVEARKMCKAVRIPPPTNLKSFALLNCRCLVKNRTKTTAKIKEN